MGRSVGAVLGPAPRACGQLKLQSRHPRGEPCEARRTLTAGVHNVSSFAAVFFLDTSR